MIEDLKNMDPNGWVLIAAGVLIFWLWFSYDREESGAAEAWRRQEVRRIHTQRAREELAKELWIERQLDAAGRP